MITRGWIFYRINFFPKASVGWNSFWSRRFFYRSSRSQLFLKILGILKYFTNFTGKYLCWSLFLIEFSKKRLQHKCFPLNFCEILRTFFYRTRLVVASVPRCLNNFIGDIAHSLDKNVTYNIFLTYFMLLVSF